MRASLAVVTALLAVTVGCSGSSVVGGPADAGGDLIDAVDATTDLGDDVVDVPTVDRPSIDAPDAMDVAVDVPPDAPARCASAADCASDPGGPACDTTTGRCVPCTAADDRCPAGQYCRDATCVTGCRDDDACNPGGAPDAGADGGPGPARRCDTNSRACVDCLANADCPSGTLCVGNVCVSGCTASQPCPAAQACCDGACVDTLGNTAHCGGCGMACTVTNGTAACLNGVCAVGACASPFADCDADRATGCETDTLSSVDHCGGCGRRCDARPNASAACGGGRCVYACDPGFADCDGNPANGCEVDTRGDTSHCGACGQVCNPPNAVPACAMGRCAVASCAAGFGDCDGNATNGCEARLNTDVTNCGACGTACEATPNAFPGCLSGRCVTSCVMGFLDCDGDPSNGCESDLRSDALNCGACGRACDLPRATGTCVTGQCRVTACDDGFADCDLSAANGCEANLRGDVANCGMCGRVCTVTGGTPACTNGVCGVATCGAGRGDCDGDAGNGCETDLNTSVSDCGACGTACALPNATATCAGGRCAVGSCAAGFADCDGNPANGCETDTRSSTASCGACGSVCALPNGTAACVASRCTLTGCSAGFADCNANGADGCEANLGTSTGNCGACGNACSLANATAACAGGACLVSACNSPFANCDGSAANGCEVSTATDPRHCGGCGRACSLPNVAVAGCAGGSCTVVTCAAGFADCDGNAANGCEVNTQTSAGNCGGCGVACPTGVCREGACQSFGGAFELSDPSCASRCFNGNAYVGGGCGCLGGFGSTVGVRTINDCAGRGTQVGAVITFCGGPTAGDYGGAFQSDDGVAGGGGCRAANPYTGGCSCPSGYAGAAFRTLVDRVDGRSGLIGSRITVCTRSGSPRPGFGGAYQVDDGVPGGVGCRAANTVTGACSCPAGTSAQALRVEVDSSAGFIGSQIFLCVR